MFCKLSAKFDEHYQQLTDVETIGLTIIHHRRHHCFHLNSCIHGTKIEV